MPHLPPLARVMLAAALTAACQSNQSSASQLNKAQHAPPPADGAPANASPARHTEELPADRNSDDGVTKSHSGQYTNAQYGFSVVIPDGLRGVSAPPPLPQHGFKINLPAGDDADATLTVYASFNTRLWKTAGDALDESMKEFDQGDGGFSVIKKSTVKLGGQEAIRLVFRYADEKSKRPITVDSVTALRSQGGEAEPSIIYEIILRAPAEDYEKHRGVLEQMLKSWRTTAAE